MSARRPPKPAEPIEIADPGDPRLTGYRSLNRPDWRGSIEADEQVFVVEGARTVRQMLASGWPLHSVLLRPEKVEPLADVVAQANRRGSPVYVAGAEVFDGIAGFPVHRGVLALAHRTAALDPRQAMAGSKTVLVIEGVNDHENLGALFRNAAALGAGAVLMDPTCCDPLYRRSVRVSVGHVLRIPFSRLTRWPDGLETVKGEGFALVALTPNADASLDEVAEAWRGGRAQPARVAVLVGAEGPGLSAGALAAATHAARIPMAPGVDSLNVATAAAIALHRLADSRVGA